MTYRWRSKPGEGRLRGQEWYVKLISLSDGLGMELMLDGMPALALPFSRKLSTDGEACVEWKGVPSRIMGPGAYSRP